MGGPHPPQLLLRAIVATLAIASPASSQPLTPRPLDNHDAYPNLSWTLVNPPNATTLRFRGLAAQSATTAWLAGTSNSVFRTTDSGQTWATPNPPLPDPASNLSVPEYRDIHVPSSDANTAVILSIGPGNDSRIYRTVDAGASWTVPFLNTDPDAFYDCLAFSDSDPSWGLALSDPVGGRFRILETRDGGASWGIVDPAGMPDALADEAGFAASGTCLVEAFGRWYVASGGENPARVFRSEDGHVWDVAESEVAGGVGAGVFSVAFRDERHGVAVGGNYSEPEQNEKSAAWSDDGGTTWSSAKKFPGGYRSGVSFVPGLCGVAIAVGPTGSDVSLDDGKTWRTFDNGSFDSVECVEGRVCWASGQSGRVARLNWE